MVFDYNKKFEKYGVSETKSETEQVVEEAETVNETEATEATETEAVIEVCWQKLRDQAERFGMADEKAKAFLDDMARELEKEEPNVEAFWDLSNRLESLKAGTVAEAESKAGKKPDVAKAKPVVHKQEPETKPVTPAKPEVTKKSEEKPKKSKKKTKAKKEMPHGGNSEKKPFSVIPFIRELIEMTPDKLKLGSMFSDLVGFSARKRSLLLALLSDDCTSFLGEAQEFARECGKITLVVLDAVPFEELQIVSSQQKLQEKGYKTNQKLYTGVAFDKETKKSVRFGTLEPEAYKVLTGRNVENIDKRDILYVTVKDGAVLHPTTFQDQITSKALLIQKQK